jgi:hypothetical protein
LSLRASVAGQIGAVEITATQLPDDNLPAGLSAEQASTSAYSTCVPISTAGTLTPQPGQAETTSAPGFAPGESVSLTLHSTPVHLTTVQADSNGLTTAHVTIPKNAAAGPHMIVFTGATSHHVVEIPITVTPKPQRGLLHLVAPKSMFAKKITHSATVRVAGHAGLPAKGARHALVLAVATVNTTIGTAKLKANAPRMLVIAAGKVKITVANRGTVRLVALGWYASAASTKGDVLRSVKRSTITKSGSLAVGTHGLPYQPGAPGVDGVVLSVTTKRGATTIGGLAVPAAKTATTVVARVVKGVVAIHLAKGATATVVGWYGGPSAAPGGRITG